MHILITYDVNTMTKEGARRLRRVADACKDYGQRVQNSVFECELTESQLLILKERVRGIIDTSVDSIRIYHLSKNYEKSIEVMGRETAYNVKDTLII